MKKIKILANKLALSFFLLATLAIPGGAFARENVTDWYIQNFDSRIIVNKDSSLSITETITADCGNCLDKHGIFRILPTSLNIAGEVASMPVELQSITNEKGLPIEYKEIKNRSDGTVTWRIGNPDVAVRGVNAYVIKYKIENTIRFADRNFDELYWNLNGNFWNLETDKFHASIVFPQNVTKENTEISLYSGVLGDKNSQSAEYFWSAPNVLEIDSTKTLPRMQGITVSATFPKDIFTPYVPSFWELYYEYVYFVIPLFVLVICFALWKKYGDDPNLEKAIIAEYEAPGKLSPIELGILMRNGKFNNSFITAEVVNLAVKGLINIKKVENKILFITTTDYELSITRNAETEQALNDSQKKIIEAMFGNESVIKLSDLKNKFYRDAKEIEKTTVKKLQENQLITARGLQFSSIFIIVAIIGGWLAISAFSKDNIILGISAGLSSAIIFAFSFIMPKRTLAGAELAWKIEGFKLFMETVDKDRAVYYEKENILEKFLPYAIVFGMTKLWIERMREIYGEQYFQTYSPAWFVGNVGAFDADSFASSMSELSSAIHSNTSAPSGSGGAGGAGGGGGGGGGGGW